MLINKIHAKDDYLKTNIIVNERIQLEYSSPFPLQLVAIHTMIALVDINM